MQGTHDAYPEETNYSSALLAYGADLDSAKF